MVWPRYLVYFVVVSSLTALMTWLEIQSPGFLKFYVPAYDGDPVGTSEFSPVEITQALILLVCAGLFGWVARNCPSQRPIAVPFGGLALAFLVREGDYFFDRFVADSFWQSLVVVILALVIVYAYRVRRRFRIAWARVWPSPGVAFWFAGGLLLFSMVPLMAHEPVWQAILGDDYVRVAKLAVEELMELTGYVLWTIGTIEYTYQARAIAYRAPQPAVQRRRQKRRHEAEGSF